MADFTSILALLLPRAPPGLDQTWGAFLIGTTISVFLNVFSLILGYKYFRLYPTDTRFLRCIVLIVLPLDLFQTIVNVYTCYWHLVTNHSNPESLILENWSFIAFGPVSVGTIVLCQLFYAHRVFRLGGHYRWIALLAALGMGASVGLDIALTVESVILPNLLAFRPITWMVTSIYGTTLYTDVILTCALVFMLWQRRTGRKDNTDTVITGIIAYTVSSGLLFTIIGILNFVFALVEHGNLVFCAIEAFGVKVYVISMLTAIILRKAFGVRMGRDDDLPTAAFELERDGQKHRPQTRPSGPKLSTIGFVPATASTSTASGTTTTGQGSSQGATESTDQTTDSV